MLRTKFTWIPALVMTGFTLSVLFTNCSEENFSATDPTGAAITSSDIGTAGDPLLDYAWHLRNTGQKVFASRAGVSGNDLNLELSWMSGIFGQNIKVLVSDDGVEDLHEDLSGNFNYNFLSRDYTLSYPYAAQRAAPRDSSDNHGTAVAGLIAASAGNGFGARGVAPKAQLAATNFLSATVSQTTATVIDQLKGNFDIYNMSWGGSQNNLSSPITGFDSQIRYGVTNGRGGKGATYVKAAGNEFVVNCRGTQDDACIGNANFDAENTSPFMILTAALNAEDRTASYSSMGANLWVSSFGGEFGDDSPAMVTTDRSGCTKGFATSSSSLAFDRGQQGNTGCNYSVTFNGTSAAAPVLSGVVALILSANPQLSWRDVKYILAKTAVPVNYVTTGGIVHPLASTLPSGYTYWEQAWKVNGAGFPFHNWYGFGKVNVDEAVALAKSYTYPLGTFSETAWAHENAGLSVAIPDNSATGASNAISVSQQMKIESVQVRLWVTHADLSELAVELTSPSGTRSIVVNMHNSLTGLANYEGEILLSNAFYQEMANGTWTLKLIDGKTGKTGTLTKWGLNFTGAY